MPKATPHPFPELQATQEVGRHVNGLVCIWQIKKVTLGGLKVTPRTGELGPARRSPEPRAQGSCHIGCDVPMPPQRETSVHLEGT